MGKNSGYGFGFAGVSLVPTDCSSHTHPVDGVVFRSALAKITKVMIPWTGSLYQNMRWWTVS